MDCLGSAASQIFFMYYIHITPLDMLRTLRLTFSIVGSCIVPGWAGLCWSVVSASSSLVITDSTAAVKIPQREVKVVSAAMHLQEQLWHIMSAVAFMSLLTRVYEILGTRVHQHALNRSTFHVLLILSFN